MTRNGLILGVLCLCLVGLTYAAMQYGKTSYRDFVILKQGETVSDLSFSTDDGRNIRLSDFEDKSIVIHFWATWCPPCLIEFPLLIDMARANASVAVIAVSTDRDQGVMTRYLDRFEPLPDNFYSVFDANKTITEDQFGVYRLPETVIIDPQRRFREHLRGAYADWTTYPFSP